MSRLASIGVAKADSLTEIQISKKMGRPIDDPSSAEIAGAFFRSRVDGHSLEAAMKSELDSARDSVSLARGIGGMVCMAADGSGSTATIDSAEPRLMERRSMSSQLLQLA